MLTPEEFQKRWPEDSPLIRFSENVIRVINIPTQAKQFLIEAGLPEEAYLGTMCLDLPRLPHSIPGTENLSTAYERYRLIGESGYQMYDCIDEMEGGRIVTVSVRESGTEIIFCNSSIHQLAYCWSYTNLI